MNIRMILYNSGRMIALASLLFLPCVIVSLICGDGCVLSFLLPAGLMVLFGGLLSLIRPKSKTSYAREGFVTATLMWLLFSVFGALPFVLSKQIPDFVDAFFETVSGFTTTGSSILTNVETLSKSILFWRSFTHWVGGMGVLALAIALLPADSESDAEDTSAMHILKAETPGPTFGRLVAKLRRNVRILYGMYAGLTLLEMVFLFAGGMPFYDTLVHSFGTAGTGGFGIYNLSIGAYDNAYFEMVIAVFMLLFGINFNIYFFLLTGNLIKVIKSEELRCYLAVVIISIGIITFSIRPLYGSFATAFRFSFFQVSSIITTTGYATADFNLWPSLSKCLLVLLMFCGGCVSSTAGGLKVARVIILFKTSLRNLRAQLDPREVRVIRCDGEDVDLSTVHNVTTYFTIYMMILLFSAVIVSIDGKDVTSTVTSVIACLNNIGPGLETVGPRGNFSEFSVLSKLVLCFDMLAGRLEIYPLLITLSPSVWRRSV